MSDRATLAARNTAYNYLAFAWRAILSLLVTPYLISRLANDAYGVLMLALLIINYLEYMYLGLGDSVTKYISSHRDSDHRNRIITSTFFVFMALGASTAVLLILFTRFFLLDIFKIPSQLAVNTQFMFYILSAAFSITLPLSTFSAALKGLQRLDLLNRVVIIQASLSTAAMLLALHLGMGLKGLISAYVVVNTLGATANLGILKHVFPDFHLSGRWFERSEIASLVRFAVPSTIGGVSFLIIFQCNIPMLSMFLPVGIVTYYILANQLASQIWIIASLVYGAMFPLVSELHSERNLDGLRELYSSATVLILSVASPVAIALFTLSDRIFLFWLAGDYQQAVLPLRALSLAWLISTLGTASSFTSRGIGRPRIDATLAVGIALANISLNFLIIPKFGIPGVLSLTIILQVIGSTINIFIVSRLIQLGSIANYLGRILRVILASLLAGLILLPSRPSLLITSMQGGVFVLVYCLLIWRFCWMKEEKRIFCSLLPRRIEKFIMPT